MRKKVNSGFSLLELVLVTGLVSAATISEINQSVDRLEQERTRVMAQDIAEIGKAISKNISYYQGLVSSSFIPNEITGVKRNSKWLQSSIECSSGENSAPDGFLPCDFLQSSNGLLSFSGLDYTTYIDSSYDTVSDTADIEAVTIFHKGSFDSPQKWVIDGQEALGLSGLASLMANLGIGSRSSEATLCIDSGTRPEICNSPVIPDDLDVDGLIVMRSTNETGSEVYLRTDGTNNMRGSISFDNSMPQNNREIKNVSRLVSSSSSGLIIGREGRYGGNPVPSLVVVDSDQEIYGNLLISSNLSVAGDVNIEGVLNIAGDSFFNNTYVQGELIANSNSQFNGIVDFNDKVTVNNELFVKSNSAAGRLGNITADNTIKALNDLIANDDLFVSDDATISGSIDVSDDSIFRQNVAITSNLDADTISTRSIKDADNSNFIIDPDKESKIDTLNLSRIKSTDSILDIKSPNGINISSGDITFNHSNGNSAFTSLANTNFLKSNSNIIQGNSLDLATEINQITVRINGQKKALKNAIGSESTQSYNEVGSIGEFYLKRFSNYTVSKDNILNASEFAYYYSAGGSVDKNCSRRKPAVSFTNANRSGRWRAITGGSGGYYNPSTSRFSRCAYKASPFLAVKVSN